jgi:hypothetical protein
VVEVPHAIVPEPDAAEGVLAAPRAAVVLVQRVTVPDAAELLDELPGALVAEVAASRYAVAVGVQRAIAQAQDETAAPPAAAELPDALQPAVPEASGLAGIRAVLDSGQATPVADAEGSEALDDFPDRVSLAIQAGSPVLARALV